MASRSVSRGERNIRWVEAVCRVPEGKLVGQPVKLRDWQRDIFKSIYDTPTRRVIVSFGRKNGKTAISAMLLLLHLVGPEARANSQLYSTAQSRDQAALLFGLAAKMVRMSPDLLPYVTIRDTAKQLLCGELGTVYRALSAEASTAYGASSVFCVHDELGQVRGPRSELYEAMETSAGAQENPLSVIISTQAPTDGDLLSILIDDAKQGADPKTKLFLYTADDDLDPFEEEAWRAANPAYGDFLNADEVREQAEAARRMPAREAAFANLVLNRRIAPSSPFIPAAVWKRCDASPDDAVFRAGPVWGGLDLSARSDLTALALIARDEHDVWHCKVEFFAPLQGLLDRARRDRAPYDVWAQQGWIMPTPGASVDYEWVAEHLEQVCAEYDVRAIAYDRWRMDVLKASLARRGLELPLEPMGQGFRDQSAALDAMESELLNERVRHGNNPVLTMCAANAIVVRDPAGNRKMDKAKATGRIDGAVALAMAFGIASRAQVERQPSYQMLILG